MALLGAPTRERLPSTPRSVERISFGAASFWVGVAVLVVFLLPARAVLQGMGAAGRPHFLIAAGLLLWWLIAQSHPELRQGRVHPLVALVFAYSGWLVVTWVLGYDRGLSVLESSSTDRALIAAAAYLGIVVVAASSRSMRQVDAVLQVAVAGAAFSAVMGWIQFWTARDYTALLILPGLEANGTLVGISARGFDQFARVAGTAGHYIEFGVVMSMVLPLAIHYTLARPPGKRRLGWVAVTLIGGAIPFSLSRSALIAFGLVTAVMLIGWPRRRRWNAVGTILLVLPVYAVVKPGLLGTIRSLFFNAANDPSITGRTEDYEEVGRYVAQRPIAGRGPGTFTPEEYRLLDNQWLLSLIEVGWVGVLLFAVVLLVTMRVLMTVRRRALFLGDQQQADLALSLLAIVVTVAVTAAFFDTFSFTTATTILWLTVGLAAALSSIQRRELARLAIEPMGVRDRLRALVRIARGRERDLTAGAWI